MWNVGTERQKMLNNEINMRSISFGYQQTKISCFQEPQQFIMVQSWGISCRRRYNEIIKSLFMNNFPLSDTH